VLVNGATRVTTFVSSTLLQATLLPSDLAQSGTLIITVMNTEPGGTTGPMSLIVTDYNISSSSSTQTVPAGQNANYSLMLAAITGQLTGTVTFSVSGLPPESSASFMPPSVAAGIASTPVTLSVTTTPHSSTSSLEYTHGAWPLGLFWCGMGLAIGMMWFALSTLRGRTRRLAPIFLTVLLLTIAVGLAACGSSVGSPGAQLNPGTGTPAGNYKITVNATSGSATIPTTVTLSVK